MNDRPMKAAADKYAASTMGRMGLTPSLTTHVAQSTPSTVIPTVQATAGPSIPAAKVAPNLSVKSNAQRDATGRAMESAYKAQKTYGVPGAK